MVICKYCGITETSYYKLNKHIAKDHAETESKTQCDKCMKELSSKQTLQKHIKSCNGLSSLQCQYCHKSLSNANSKYRHRKTCKLKQEKKEGPQEIKSNEINITREITNSIIIFDMDQSIIFDNLPHMNDVEP